MGSVTQIGRYEVKRRTGSHGTAALYEAFDPVMKRSVTIRIAEGESEDAAAGEETSGTAPFDPHQMAGLDHPNIIRVLACEEDGARPYLVMEQFEGRPLSAQPNLDPAKVSEILKSAASALDHVHAKGLIHNHLTPDSIVLSEDGLMKVAGFEVACVPEHAYAEHADQEYTRAQTAAAIPYMPPEFLKGEKLDARSDQFSLAAIAFHALTGTHPFQASTAVGLLRQVMFEKPTLGKLRDKFPLAVLKVFETALAGTPSARYTSCSEFALALDTALTATSHESAATRLATPMPEPRQEALSRTAVAAPVDRGGSNRWLVWIVGLVLLAGLGVLAMKLFTPTPTAVTPTPPPKAPTEALTPAPTPTPAKTVPPATGQAATGQTAKSAKPKSKTDVKTDSKPASKAAVAGAAEAPESNPPAAPSGKQASQDKAAPVTPPAAEQPAPAPTPAKKPKMILPDLK